MDILGEVKVQVYKCQSTVQVGNIQIGGPAFSVIAGPCSIESEEQFSTAAQGVKKAGACLLRGGVWKMRTSPDTFQGLGGTALSFVRATCKNVGMGLVTEVTDPRQIGDLYDYVDMFQVGSRNMYNYSLLKELGTLKKPILLKRGLSALVTEWIKSAEYITKGGNTNVILCERGIRTFETSTRNTLDLNAVAYLKANTEFPVIVDPSHGVGVRELIPRLALASAAVGADGMMIEVHPRPEEALSDGFQALNIEQFSDLMADLEKVLTAIGKPLQRAN